MPEVLAIMPESLIPEIYRRTGNSWTQVSGALKHVSVANDGTVWGVNDDDEIYRCNGSAWDQVPGLVEADLLGRGEHRVGRQRQRPDLQAQINMRETVFFTGARRLPAGPPSRRGEKRAV